MYRKLSHSLYKTWLLHEGIDEMAEYPGKVKEFAVAVWS